jgi:hypothetical protein
MFAYQRLTEESRFTVLTLNELLNLVAGVSWPVYLIIIAAAFFMSLRANLLPMFAKRILEALAIRKIDT